MVGISNFTSVTMNNLTYIGNSSNLPEFIIKVNQVVYNGWMVFILLIVLWAILFIASQKVIDQPLNNLMYSGAIVTVVSLFVRAIQVYINGFAVGMLTDHQMWIFPLITIMIAIVLWSTQE